MTLTLNDKCEDCKNGWFECTCKALPVLEGINRLRTMKKHNDAGKGIPNFGTEGYHGLADDILIQIIQGLLFDSPHTGSLIEEYYDGIEKWYA